MTRDSLLPIVAPLALAKAEGVPIERLVATLPPRFTAADRLTGIAPDRSAALLAALREDQTLQTRLLCSPSAPVQIDETDGFRATFSDGTIRHLRPSGNAPEFRVYTEAASPEQAHTLLSETLREVAAALS